MLRLAWRNLTHERVRLTISAGGVALAILLILMMKGIFAGSEEHAVIYIRNQPAPLWLMQAGVENIHMSSSMLPPDAIERVKAVSGVEEAVGVLYSAAAVEIGDSLVASYLFGIDPDIPFGGPWSMVEGTANLGLNEIVIDSALARRHGLGLGDTVSIMGYKLTIAGLSEGTLGIATSIVFVNKAALALATGVSPQAASYILVQSEPTADLEALADALRAAVPEANVLTQTDLIAKERDLIQQMGADVLLAMTTVAYVIGLLVIGLTIYTATLERAREYGVLKALGADSKRLLSVVFAQAFIAAGLGYIIGVALAYAAAASVNRLFPEMLILIEPIRWLREVPMLAMIVALAAFLPVQRITRLDPMVVFQA